VKKTVIVFALFLLAEPLFAGENPSYIELGDLCYSSREIESSCEASIGFYELAILSGVPSYEPSWKAARSCVFLADSTTECDPLLVRGESFIKMSVAASPEGMEGNYWFGVIMERFGEIRNPFLRIAIDEEVERRMLAALAVDPEFDGAHRTLATAYRRTVGYPVSIGSTEKALEEAKLAVRYGPKNAANYLVLAHVYSDLRDTESFEENMAVAEKLASSSEASPEDKIAWERTRRMFNFQ